MAGRKNDRELLTLARPNNTPALQARLILILDNVEFHLEQRALRNFMRYISQKFLFITRQRRLINFLDFS